jgi:hypothetical protein
MPALKRIKMPEGVHYYYTCKDVTVLSTHEVYAQAWETVELAIHRWNHAIKTLEKRKAKNIKDGATWGG